MTGYPNNNSAGSQAPTGTTAQSDVAAQGGYLGKAQGWTSRVTANLQGQAEQLKGKIAGSQGTSTGQGTATGHLPPGNKPGPGAGTGGSTAYSESNTSYGQPGTPAGAGSNTSYGQPATGHNNHLSHGYAPAQATSGTAADGTYGSTAQKPSLIDQAKQWTARAVTNLHGQAEYLKGMVAGHPSTPAPPTAGGVGYSPATHVGSGQGTGTAAGHGEGSQYSRAGGPAAAASTGAPQAKKSWTETAKGGLLSGLTYTQQGLEVVKNKVGGAPGSSPGTTHAGATGTSYSAGMGPGAAGTHTPAGHPTSTPNTDSTYKPYV